ncbi:hypothetical protein ACFQ5J_05445 [Lacticaseibacillus baoqingensis]|uniref:Uncharacterized protein n=1 Tax=Lacticaseibacillus baoqingensis TaxID=2486013 RepID=A0ABW4E776_9LACO|nr:hypothetical protein [Lacticaseibacillus baoqingensis]
MKEKRHEISILGTLFVIVPVGLLDAVVSMYGWNTFMVSAFGVPKMKLISTWGLLVFLNYLIMKKKDFSDDNRMTWEDLIIVILTTLYVWIMMFVLHFFI